MSQEPGRVAVVICSVGRPESLRGLVPALVKQTRPANHVVFVVTKPDDIDFDPTAEFGDNTTSEVLIAEKGLPIQRNAGLDALGDAYDLVVFFDDDFIPSRYALAGIEAVFAAFPEISGVTGALIADGINRAGFSQADADRMVEAWDEAHRPPAKVSADLITNWHARGLYGCNMAYRMSAVGQVRFDETLPLYAWQEDVDFSARMPGRIVVTTAFAGVHRGAKSGRETAGRRLGYSQIANPYYLWRKGTMTTAFAGKIAFRNVVANHLKVVRPEPWIDRRERAAGNRTALVDIVLRRSDPRRILDLQPASLGEGRK